MKMITNLFSMFDPSTAPINLNWIIIMTPILFLPKILLKIRKYQILNLILKNYLRREISSILENSKKNSSVNILFIIFIFIFLLNILSLFPYNFTIASQISFTFPSAILIWLTFIILGWLKNSKRILAHLLPLGTPPTLIPIIVIIEIISQIIRPITLSVRLTANMVAGHLLIRLLGSFALSSISLSILCSPLILALTFLEVCVSAIQAFVFITLISLYSTEIN
jgi:F-type H+-transporting ATPase subunit a